MTCPATAIASPAENPYASMNVTVGYSCNNNCIHCMIGYERRKITRDRTTAEIKSQISNAKKEGSSQVILIGGEPTIRGDFLEILGFAKRARLGIGIESNGRMFSSEEFTKQVLATAPNAHFSISFHHTNPKVHDRIVRIKGAWNQTVEGMRNLSKFGAKEITAIPVITKFNYANLPAIVDLCKDCGAGEIAFTFVHGGGNALKYYERIVPRARAVIPYLLAAMERGNGLGVCVRTYAFPYCMIRGYEKHAYELNFVGLYLKNRKIKFREIEDENVEWQSERLLAKAKALKCKPCRYFNVCEGVWGEYIRRFGAGELKPFNGEQIKSMESLQKVLNASK